MFKIKRKHYKLRFYPQSESSRVLWIEPNYSIDTEDFVYDYLQNGDTFVDVGSNIGLVTLTAAVKAGPSGKVYSIEPHPAIFLNLKGNIQLNSFDNIHTFNTALGNQKGKINFSDSRSDSMNSISEDSSGISVPICKLDDLPISEQSIALIKIDVEGYEQFVLLGALNKLKITKCVYFETLEKLYKKYNYTHEDVFNILRNEGFNLYRLRDKKISLLKDRLSENDLDIIAIRDLDDFLNRTKFQLDDK
ncbi:MAG: FkbM family methyltransferase [Pelagibacterales bacterium]|nr:FkbM family methyltransferase [Pelagibacterales bacterium]